MPNKSLGQHWLRDRQILKSIADSASITEEDTVLEIGPGLGTLTSVLLAKARRVVAVEYDSDLAAKLPAQFPGKQLEVYNADFLQFDLRTLPKRYKIVANVPYYITQKIVEHVLAANNQPEVMALLVQREVAEKLAAKPGEMTLISVRAQLFYDIHLSTRVPKEYFTPPPKVDSQVVVFKKRHVLKFAAKESTRLMRAVKAGFSSPRKKLVSSLSGGLVIDKSHIEMIIEKLGWPTDIRAQELSVQDWIDLVDKIAEL